jgi:hypothetical protein
LKRGLGRGFGVVELRRGVQGAWYEEDGQDSETKEDESEGDEREV